MANGSNFLFHVVMSRLLGPDRYGALGSLLGIITVVTFGAGALQAAVIQAAARAGHQGALALGRYSWRSVLVAAAALGAAAALSPGLASFLHLASPVPVVLLGVFLSLTLLAVVPQGILLGRLSFAVVAVSLVVGAVLRLGAGVLLVELGLGLDGALAATAVSAAGILGVLLWPLRHDLWSRHGERMGMHVGPAVLAVGAVGGFSALVGVDTFLARHYLSAAAAGHYAAAATAARSALFMPSAIALVAFPRLTSAGLPGAGARQVLVHGIVAVAALAAATGAVMVAVPHTVIAVLFGGRYESAAGTLRILAVAAAGLGVLSLLVYAQVARGRAQALVAWLGVALAAALIAVFHASPATLAWIVLGVTGLVLVLAVPRALPARGLAAKHVSSAWDPASATTPAPSLRGLDGS